MDNAIQMFKFEGKREIRVVQGEDGEPWFIVKDVCEILGIQNASDALGYVDPDEKGVAEIYTLGGNQNALTINESGLYALVMRSNKPEAKPFRRWVTSEVLPSIRKTGSYSIAPATPANVALALAQALVSIEDRVTRLEATQRAAEVALLELPAPTVTAPEKSLRAALNESVRGYALKTGVTYPDVWGKLYRELKYRAGFDAVTRSKHNHKSTLDLVEEAGLLPELYAIAREVLI